RTVEWHLHHVFEKLGISSDGICTWPSSKPGLAGPDDRAGHTGGPSPPCRTHSVASPTSTYSNLKPSNTSYSESQERLHEGRRALVVPGRGPGRTGLTWRIRRGSLSGDRRVSYVRLLCDAAGEADGLSPGGLAL